MSLVHQANAGTKSLRAPLQGLHVLPALPQNRSLVALRLPEEWQEALCCTLIRSRPRSYGWGSLLVSAVSKAAGDKESLHGLRLN